MDGRPGLDVGSGETSVSGNGVGESGGHDGLSPLDIRETELRQGMDAARQRLMELRRDIYETEAGILRLEGALTLIADLKQSDQK